jgi:hypothetical protein
MDPSDSREVMRKQAAALVVVLVAFVSSRLKRKMSSHNTELNPACN